MSTPDRYRAALRPAALPLVPGLELARGERGAAEYSGDAHDAFVQGERAWVWLADASDVGFSAAARALVVRACLRSHCLAGASPSAALARTNRDLPALCPPQGFVSCLLLRWEPERGALTWSSAGFEPFMIYRAAEERVEVVKSGGVVLGVTDGASFQDHELLLAPGDALLLATDGLAESSRVDGSLLGVEEVSLALAQRARGASAAELIAGLQEWLEEQRESAESADDVSMLVVKRTGPSLG